MQRAHTYLTWEQLAKALGLPGRPIKVWVEPDNDYVHIMLEDESFEERPDGSYVEAQDIAALRSLATT